MYNLLLRNLCATLLVGPLLLTVNSGLRPDAIWLTDWLSIAMYCAVPYIAACVDVSGMVLSGPFSVPLSTTGLRSAGYPLCVFVWCVLPLIPGLSPIYLCWYHSETYQGWTEPPCEVVLEHLPVVVTQYYQPSGTHITHPKTQSSSGPRLLKYLWKFLFLYVILVFCHYRYQR